MKRLATVLSICAALFFCAAALADELTGEMADRIAAVPNPRPAGGWVADPANVIAARKADINQLIGDLQTRSSVEIAVVVLPTIGELVPKDFAGLLFERWGIGKAGKDNGLLVLHVLDQRRIEIETGYGMESILPDVKCHWITEEIAVPFFKKNSLADGHLEVVRALIRGIDKPDITHADLISQLTTQPGASVDALPEIDRHDAIALQYSSLPKRALYSGWMPLVLLGVGGLIFVLVTASYRSRSKGKPPYVRYKMFDSGMTRWQYAAALPIGASALVAEFAQNATFFSPIPVLLGTFFLTLWRRGKVLKELRDAPRTCECGKSMRRLGEREDDAYIEKGNIAEEAINSMDYDVWVCECGKSQVESYRGKAHAQACPKCGFRTFRTTNSRVVRAATTHSTGLREVTNQCANCSYTKTDTDIIPKVSTSSSSGGSSGRSGGSFGGGRSGGGGAGSSY